MEETTGKAEQASGHGPSLGRMLSSAGNPSMDNLAVIFHAIRERLNVNLEAHSVAA